jgi:excisionase family DNA binding protein
MVPTSERISVADAAEILGVSARHVYDLAAPAGPIPCYRIGGRVVFERAEVEAYFESCRCVKAPPPAPTRLTSTRIPGYGESALEASFRRMGLKPKPRPSAKQKPK